MMKKILALLFLACSVGWSENTYTTNAGIPKPADGDTGWGTTIRAAYDVIDSSFAVLNGTQTFTGTITLPKTSTITFYGSPSVPINYGTSRLLKTQYTTDLCFGIGACTLSGGASVGNTVFGNSALSAMNSGADQNSAFGFFALGNNTSGVQNSGFGHYSLQSNISGQNNTAVGTRALNIAQTGSYNTAIGDHAGGDATALQGLVSGSSNTFVGYNASQPASAVLSNATAIGADSVVTSSNTIELGRYGDVTSFQMVSKTLAQLQVLTPNRVGQPFYCSDCANMTVCISTGNATPYAVASSSRTRCQ